VSTENQDTYEEASQGADDCGHAALGNQPLPWFDILVAGERFFEYEVTDADGQTEVSRRGARVGIGLRWLRLWARGWRFRGIVQSWPGQRLPAAEAAQMPRVPCNASALPGNRQGVLLCQGKLNSCLGNLYIQLEQLSSPVRKVMAK
jgi:hypothetical protein